MKRTFMTGLLLAGSLCFAFSQTTSNPMRELGVRFQGINFDGQNAFSLVYKKQKGENRYRRWRGVFSNLSLALGEEDTSIFGFHVGFLTGIEKRKPLTGVFLFNYGLEYGPELALNLVEDDNYVGIGGSVGYALGIQYQPNDRFFVNLETVPAVRAFLNAREEETIFIFNAGFHALADLTIGWRF